MKTKPTIEDMPEFNEGLSSIPIEDKLYIDKKFKEIKWKEYCEKCQKFHIFTLKPCPSCGVHLTPQPASDKVMEKHTPYHYQCDGCDAYRDHLNV